MAPRSGVRCTVLSGSKLAECSGNEIILPCTVSLAVIGIHRTKLTFEIRIFPSQNRVITQSVPEQDIAIPMFTPDRYYVHVLGANIRTSLEYKYMTDGTRANDRYSRWNRAPT